MVKPRVASPPPTSTLRVRNVFISQAGFRSLSPCSRGQAPRFLFLSRLISLRFLCLFIFFTRLRFTESA